MISRRCSRCREPFISSLNHRLCPACKRITVKCAHFSQQANRRCQNVPMPHMDLCYFHARMAGTLGRPRHRCHDCGTSLVRGKCRECLRIAELRLAESQIERTALRQRYRHVDNPLKCPLCCGIPSRVEIPPVRLVGEPVRCRACGTLAEVEQISLDEFATARVGWM